MPNVVTALAVLVPCLITGMGLSHLGGRCWRFEERLAAAVPVGALTVALAGWVIGTVRGLDGATVALAVTASLGLSVPGWWRGRHRLVPEAHDVWRRIGLPWADPESLRPLLALLAVAWPITVRIFALAWVSDGGGLAAGHLATFSDGSAHLAYAGIMTGEGVIPPGSPIAAGEPARYHLLIDFFAAQVSLVGVPLPSALSITGGYLALAFPAVMYLCGLRILGSRSVAALAVVIFCAGGGLGFIRLAADIGDHGWDALIHPIRSYTRDPVRDLWMDNPVLSYLHAQRNGLMGLPVALITWTMVAEALRGAAAQRRHLLTGAGVLIGLTPLANGFAWTVVLAVVAVWALIEAGSGWWRFFAPAVALGAPVAWWLQPESSSLRLHLGWMAEGGLPGWLAFWAVNAGPFLVLLVVAHLWRGTIPRSVLAGFAPFWALWVIPNLVAFHPWEWNNTKYFAFWQLVGSLLVAAVVVRVARSGRAGLVTAVVLMTLLGASGTLDLRRATDPAVTTIGWSDADGMATARWVRSQTPRGSVLATAAVVDNPVTSLGGRAVLSGYPGWTWDIGVADWAERVEDTATIVRGGPAATAAAARRRVTHVVIGPLERREIPDIDRSWWEDTAERVHQQGEWIIYRIR